MADLTSIEPTIMTNLFYDFTHPAETISICEVFNRIKTGTYKDKVIQLRGYIQSSEKAKADTLKKQLPGFTPSGTFNERRKFNHLADYSKVLHLDFDKIPPEDIDELFKTISNDVYTFACFRSPSGLGIKVFIRTDANDDKHAIMISYLMNYYSSFTGISPDPQCRDISRLCFVSYDPNLYFNPDAVVLSSESILQNENETFLFDSDEQYDNKFIACVEFTNRKSEYVEGNRNNYIYLLAANCNRVGIPIADATSFIIAKYDLKASEIEASIKSAYENNKAEFCSFADFAKLQSPVHSSNDIDYLLSTPVIPDSVFDDLPELLKAGCSAFPNKRERDVFLTGALAILSGCMPNVTGVYAQQFVYPSLFSFIVAPAASGKGALKFSKMLADKQHELILQQSRLEEKEYETELRSYQSKLRFRKKSDADPVPPVKNKFKVLFIPANSSYAKVLSHLNENGGSGIICETEADTMGNVLKQEWGSYSDMMRKAFHHEKISSSKRTNNEYIEVNDPRLAIALSGTPSQVTGLITSSEDGLFSRFIFYSFKAETVWQDVSPFCSKINLTSHFTALSEMVTLMYQLHLNSTTEVLLSVIQWAKLNVFFDKLLLTIVIFYGDDSTSIIKRLGLILFRFCMILTAIRKFENNISDEKVTCSDSDFEIAFALTQVYLQHSLLMFNNLPKQDKLNLLTKGNNKTDFYNALPAKFKRSDAVVLGKSYDLSPRTVDSLLKSLINIKLKQETYGTYSKI